ncbi:MAG: FliM/FliN family flagellar motor switch protein [Pseudomonadota bacterium]
MAQTDTKSASDSLSGELGPGGLDRLVELVGNAPGPKPPQDVKSYRFGRDNLADLSDYNGLETVNERFCRMAREDLYSFLRMPPKFTFVQPGVETFGDFCQGLDPYLSLTTLRVDALRANCLIVLRPEFISLLTNAYFGGALEYQSSDKREFTASETRVRDLFVGMAAGTLGRAWHDLLEVDFEVRAHEDNLQYVAFVAPNEPVLRSSFLIHLPDVDPALMEVVYPVQALKMVAPEMRTAMQHLSNQNDRAWRARFERAVMNIPFAATAQLARFDMPLAQLASLKTGDVMPVELGLSPKLIVDGAPLFEVTPGQRGRRAAVSLDHKLDLQDREEDTP